MKWNNSNRVQIMLFVISPLLLKLYLLYPHILVLNIIVTIMMWQLLPDHFVMVKSPCLYPGQMLEQPQLTPLSVNLHQLYIQSLVDV